VENEKEPFERSFENLEELADTISEALQCSVTIEDANHQLISYSSHNAQTDPARISTIIGKRVPEKVIQTLWRDGVIQKLMKSDEPVMISAIDEIGLGDRIAIAIRKDNNILGYIWIVLVEGISQNDLINKQLVKAAKAARTKLLQLQMKHRKTEQSYQEFFRQLLTGGMKSDLEVKQQANKLGLLLPAFFCVNVLQFPSEITTKLNQQIQYLVTTTLQDRIALYTMSNEQLILLEVVPSIKIPNPTPLLFTLLTEQMTQHFVYAPSSGGCGSVCDNYAMVDRSYQEALTVIQIKQKFPEETKSVLYYADLGFYRLLPAIVKDNQDHFYENECLQKIEAYDLEHNGELMHTLEVYLCNDSRGKESADILHIHENTLNYRLKRISKIGGIDLSSMDQKVTCYLEIKTKQYC
jgi:DNA-binding PucR family transcriptional regulator